MGHGPSPFFHAHVSLSPARNFQLVLLGLSLQHLVCTRAGGIFHGWPKRWPSDSSSARDTRIALRTLLHKLSPDSCRRLARARATMALLHWCRRGRGPTVFSRVHLGKVFLLCERSELKRFHVPTGPRSDSVELTGGWDLSSENSR